MRFSGDDRAGLYITVIVHLVVLIVLLSIRLGAAIKKENSFVLDFTKAEQIEKIEKELALKQAINDRLNEMLASGGYEPVRNIAVDRSVLKDDRNSAEDARKLYEDVEKLKRDLQTAPEVPEENEVVAAPQPRKKEEKKESHYSGPSVLSYELEGRKASRLPIPAYRCMGSGEVKINIGVDKQGNVVVAKVDEGASSPDGCLRSFAVRAARMSKFSASATAPNNQAGYIIYQFVAQ
ncbi:MAG: hypothetical protein IJ222_04815 [Bacteroidales bacterium]|nr:hypothetical protein [Bacteroidales bacterium]